MNESGQNETPAEPTTPPTDREAIEGMPVPPPPEAGAYEGQLEDGPLPDTGEDAGEEGAEEGATEGEGEGAAEGSAPGGAGAPQGGKREARPRKKPRMVRAPRPVLPADLKAEAREGALARYAAFAGAPIDLVRATVDLLDADLSIVFLARYRRDKTGGLDERRLRTIQDEWDDLKKVEERRVELRELLRTNGALTPESEERLAKSPDVPAMEDVAAPYLPVVASRATVARGHGLEPLARAIRTATEGTLLADLAKPFVKEPKEDDPGVSLDGALGGARDILAEEIGLDAELRARLRELFRREATMGVTLRTDRKGDAGRWGGFLGDQGPVSKVPAMKVLAIRRGEKERILAVTIEPPEDKALPIVHKHACPETHPHAGFLRAAAEDGYRRILKALLQNEIRTAIKDRADRQVMDTYERSLRNLLLGPVGGARPVLGLKPDVQRGHAWCAVDAEGLPVGAGTLPHEPSAGREAVLAELREVVARYECTAVAVGSGAGRAEALSLAEESVGGASPQRDVVVVPDGGTRALEAMGKLSFDDHRPEVPAECRGALSLAKRFQDPLSELVRIDPKALALGPHIHDVHQGHLKRVLDHAVASVVGYVGVDAETADVDLLAHVPGFDRAKAKALDAWRRSGATLTAKALLATIDGVGPETAEQAVGFIRLPHAEDPRDRTLLHPEHYGLVEKMAEQVGATVADLCSQPALRARVNLRALESEEAPLPLLKAVLYQVTHGREDPRPRWTQPIPPPPGTTLDSLRPGLMLEGRVVRAVPFGVFVDVGLGTEALLPVPHIGDRPGLDPATVAPVGAVIQARVLEIEPGKRRLTLTMRSERFDVWVPRGDRRGGERPRAGERPPRAGERPRGGDRAPGGPRREGDRGPRRPERDHRQGPPRVARPDTAERPEPAAASAEGAKPAASTPRPGGKGGKKGKFQVQELGLFDRHKFRDEPGTPRRISLKADDQLTPEQQLAKKLAELGGGGK